MKKLLVMTAAAGLLVVASIEEASARYRGGGFGGGFRGAGFGGGFRGVGIGGGYRGVGFRTAAIGGYGFRGARIGWGGARYLGGYGVARRVAWAGRGYYPYRYGYRRYGWGLPVAAGLGLVAASAYNNCWQYNGWQWVNVCYSPYGYGKATATATATATAMATATETATAITSSVERRGEDAEARAGCKPRGQRVQGAASPLRPRQPCLGAHHLIALLELR